MNLVLPALISGVFVCGLAIGAAGVIVHHHRHHGIATAGHSAGSGAAYDGPSSHDALPYGWVLGGCGGDLPDASWSRPTAAPEPSGLALLIAPILMAGWLDRRRKRHAIDETGLLRPR